MLFRSTLPIAFSLMFFLTANIIRQAGNNVQDSSFLDSLFRIILMFVSIYLMYKVTKSFSGAFGKMMDPEFKSELRHAD